MNAAKWAMVAFAIAAICAAVDLVVKINSWYLVGKVVCP